MKFDNYLVRIPEGQEFADGYVALRHGTQYSLSLLLLGEWYSTKPNRYNAQITIDGIDVGTWRVTSGQMTTIEHGVDDNGKFTFYRADSREAIAVGLDSVNRNQLGLVSVTFIPEKKPSRYGSGQSISKLVTRGDINAYDENTTRGGFTVGGTGLSGRSQQEFDIAENMILDRSKAVTISLRLICDSSRDDNESRPLRGNPVPPPIA